MRYRDKLVQVLAFGGWTQDRLADLFGVSNNTVNSWVNGVFEPKDGNAKMIDEIYDELVAPYTCELEAKADKIAARLMRRQIGELPENNICKKEEK